jgi:hypothetical protein
VDFLTFLAEKGFVWKEKWLQLSSWFSPILSEEDNYLPRLPTARPRVTISIAPPPLSYRISEVARLLSAKYFFGFLSAENARELLQTKELGSYLLRFSSTPGCLALSANNTTGVFHCRLYTQPSVAGMSITVDGVTYPDIDEVLHSSGTMIIPCDRKIDLVSK